MGYEKVIRGTLFTLWRRGVGSKAIRVWITLLHAWNPSHVAEEARGINLPRRAGPEVCVFYFVLLFVFSGLFFRCVSCFCIRCVYVCVCKGESRECQGDVSLFLPEFHVFVTFMCVCRINISILSRLSFPSFQVGCRRSGRVSWASPAASRRSASPRRVPFSLRRARWACRSETQKSRTVK